MPQLILSKGTTYRINLFKRIFPNIELGPYFLMMSLIFFVALITVSTLVFSTRQVTKGYVMNSLEAKHQNLVKESEEKEVLISTVKSLNYIQNSSKVKRMVRPREIVYLNNETAIASR